MFLFVAGNELIDSLRWFYMGRFATKMFCATSVAMLEQCCNNVATLCCAENRCCECPCNITFKQRRRGRLQKRYLKSNFVLLQNLSRLFHFVQFFKCWHFFWSWILKGWKRSSRKEKENCCLLLTSSKKRKIWHFHVVVVQWRQRSVQEKCDSGAKLLFCQSKPIALIFCRFR